MIKAVLFDAGDTLLHLQRPVGEVYARLAARHGVTVDPDDIEQRFRAAFRQAPPLCFPNATAERVAEHEYAWWRELVRVVFEGMRFADFDAFSRALFDYFARPQNWELFADSVPTLTALRGRGLRLGVVSNFDARLFVICDGLNLTRYFDTIVVSGRAGAAKPDPQIFRATLARLGTDAAATLHVGDSEREDRQAARAAGLHALRLDRNAASPAGDVISTLAQVVGWLDSRQ